MNPDEKRKEIRNQRKQEIAALLGVSFYEVIERFIADLVGCHSGGSNERGMAREWLLFCFHQYFGRGDYDKDRERLEELRGLLSFFDEPTRQELENQAGIAPATVYARPDC